MLSWPKSSTHTFHPYYLSSSVTVITAMDFVLLAVTIAVELNKKRWRDLCGQQQCVQGDLVIEKLNNIENVAFKKSVVELFENNLKDVQEHLHADVLAIHFIYSANRVNYHPFLICFLFDSLHSRERYSHPHCCQIPRIGKEVLLL